MSAAPKPVGSAAQPLAVAYASLYPFSGWRWPGQLAWDQLFVLPYPPWRDNVDIVVNVLGYGPLGFLLFLVALRRPVSPVWAALVAVLWASALSYAMEVTQQFLPGRYPSALDWMTNTGGGALGVGLGAGLHACSWWGRWQEARDRWFSHRSGGALALLLTWPLGFLFPLPFPFGVGPAWGRIQDALLESLLSGPGVPTWLEAWADAATVPRTLGWEAEVFGTALGLIAPCLLAFSITHAGWRRLAVVPVLAATGALTTTLSTAVNFGPTHALAWLTPSVPWALGGAALVAALCAALPQRWAAAFGLAALSALMVLVAQAPADPFFSLSLQAWEQGRFIHFHGFAQWVGWAWPVVAMAWLTRRAVEPPLPGTDAVRRLQRPRRR
jgi:VanZ family protein